MLPAAARAQPVRPWRIAGGVCIALAGHVPASGLWLVSLYTFVVYSTPDSPFLVDCCVILMQIVLFIGCVVTGVVLIRRGERGIGPGLLIGWAVGIVGLVVGTLLVGAVATAS
jgi:hypothetical protein